MDNKKQISLGEFVSREVIMSQSILVDELLKREVLSFDDIINHLKPNGEMLSEYGTVEAVREARENGEGYNEIFEWWAVSGWLLDKLEAKGEPVLKTDLGDWWGRCTTGQSIILDGIIEEIFDDMNKTTSKPW